MKRLLALVLMAIMTVGAIVARDKVYYNDSCLPQSAKTILSRNFKSKVHHVKVDKKTFGGDEYEVVLQNGTEIDFDSDGNWKEIDCGKSGVPSSLVLKPIATYVKKNFNNSPIVKIEVDRNHYEVELLNGAELKFDRSGRFLKVDD